MKHSRSSLFLMELLLAILFFSIASAVCIRMFVRAHTVSAQTIDTNKAIVQAQNLAEAWLSADGDLNEVASLLPGASLEEIYPPRCLTLAFDADWNVVELGDTEETAYTATLESYDADSDDGLINAFITVRKMKQSGSLTEAPADSSILYSLQLEHHVSGGTNHEQ